MGASHRRRPDPWSIAQPVFSSSSPPLSLHLSFLLHLLPLHRLFLFFPHHLFPSDYHFLFLSSSTSSPTTSYPFSVTSSSSSSFHFSFNSPTAPPPGLSPPRLPPLPSPPLFPPLPPSPSLFQSLLLRFIFIPRVFLVFMGPLPVFLLVCFRSVWFDPTMTPRGQNFPEFLLINHYTFLSGEQSSVEAKEKSDVTTGSPAIKTGFILFKLSESLKSELDSLVPPLEASILLQVRSRATAEMTKNITHSL